VYEYEQTELMMQSNMTFKEGGHHSGNESGDNLSNSSNSQRKNEADGGSGSTVKKMSKKDKLKNFFGKTKK
jgi:hypothetical protein